MSESEPDHDLDSLSERDSYSDTGSEYEPDSDVEIEKPPTLHNYVNEAKSSILSVQVISTQHALAINKKMQENLKALRVELEAMLAHIQQKYSHNEQILLQSKNNPKTTKRMKNFYICGAPFFKDKKLFTHPSNADYLHRSRTLHEFFPIDSALTPTHWVAKDKHFLINGVKLQALAYVNARARDTIRTIKDDDEQSQIARATIASETRALTKKPLAYILAMIKDAATQFKLDWFTISTKDLNARHTPGECEAVWQGYMQPTLNREPWSPDEEESLCNVAAAFNHQNWEAIAEKMSNRSGYQCLVTYQTMPAQRTYLKHARWTKEEDAFLMETVERNRIGSMIQWSSVMQMIPARTKIQLYHRYMFSLQPEIKKDKFTVEEDCILMAGIKEFGKQFHKFPAHLLPGRTTLQIRNRYNNVLKFVGKTTHWTFEHDETLLEQVRVHGTSNWAEVAKSVPHTRISCRSRYTTVTKFLQNNPKSSLTEVPRRRNGQSTAVTEDNWMETMIRMKTDAPRNNDTVPLCRRDYYDYFKYAYDFELAPLRQPDDRVTPATTHMVCQLLRNKICPKDFSMLHSSSDTIKSVNLQYLNFNHATMPEILVPANWCTALLLRAMTVMFPCRPNAVPTLQNHTALTLFKQRFRLLVRNAAAVAQLRRTHTPDTGNSNQVVVYGRKQEPELNDNIETYEVLEIDDLESTSMRSPFANAADDNFETSYTIAIVETNGDEVVADEEEAFQVPPPALKKRKFNG